MVVIILSILFLVILLVLPTMLYRRAALQVVEIFKKHRALSINNAKTIHALGLSSPGFKQKLLSFRDYKPRALDALIQGGIIQSTEDGNFFLVEEKLAGSKLVNKQ